MKYKITLAALPFNVTRYLTPLYLERVITPWYLGYTISGFGVSPSVDKIKAVREMQEPRDVKGVREFVGMANYFRFLIPNFSQKSAPLTALTTKNGDWREGKLPQDAKEAFHLLKDHLVAAPVVQYPRREGKFTLHTDGCTGDAKKPGGLGATLMQTQDGHERVIAYASRPLKDHEKNYGAFLLEMAAACFGICLLYTSPSPRDKRQSRMPSSA